MATNRPVTITPSSMAPSAAKAVALPAIAVDRRRIDDDRRQHRQQRGDDHLLDRRLGQHVDGAAVVRLLRALHDAGLLAELAAHLLHHRLRRRGRPRSSPCRRTGRAAGRRTAGRPRRRGWQSEKSDVDARGSTDARLGVGGEVLQVLGVGGEQHQRAEAGRADGIALGHRLGGVADRVERVGGSCAPPSAGRPSRRCRRRCR